MVGITAVIKQAIRHVKYRIKSKAIILLYHRVVELETDPYLLAVTPQHFAEHLEIVWELGHPMTLQHLAQNLRDGHVIDRAIVLTFDDGYRDNLYYAKPLLEQYNIPATVFVTTGQVGTTREFWWDELAQLLLSPGKFPPRLCLNIDGRTLDFPLDASAEYYEDDFVHHRHWHVERTDDPSVRHRVFRALYDLLQPLSHAQQFRVLDQVRAQADIASMNRELNLICSRDQVAQLSEDGLIEIGAHTVTHPLLANLSVDAQRDEICQSKIDLQDMLNRPVKSMAYPHGSYSDQTRALVREAGFACACASITDVVWQSAERFQLPRVGVRDWDGETFARWLKAWLGN